MRGDEPEPGLVLALERLCVRCERIACYQGGMDYEGSELTADADADASADDVTYVGLAVFEVHPL